MMLFGLWTLFSSNLKVSDELSNFYVYISLQTLWIPVGVTCTCTLKASNSLTLKIHAVKVLYKKKIQLFSICT